MLFTSLCAALLATAQLAIGGPVQSQGDALFKRQTQPTCVQGLIIPYSKQDLEYLRTWLLETDPNTNDFIGKNGWFQWTLGSVKVSCSTMSIKEINLVWKMARLLTWHSFLVGLQL